jgi:hypothetical protein
MITLFFSYAHADEALRDRLDRHLAMLKRQGVIDVWHDRRIVPGEPIDEAIAAELERADLILLLVSPDFLASDYCYEREMRRALERHTAGEAQVLPVILRPCDWHEAPFGHLLATPTDGKPITKFADLDDAFLDVTKAIRVALAASPRMAASPRKTASSDRIDDTGAGAPADPRSSNLRLKKSFTEADKDRFLDESFEFMVRYFENSLGELEKRNPGIETTFKRIDTHQFTAVAYRDGHAQARCRIFMARALTGGIAYSANDRGFGDSYNENISVEADEQSLFLRPLGMSMHMRNGREARWTMEGAAEYYWSMFIDPLQR